MINKCVCLHQHYTSSINGVLSSSTGNLEVHDDLENVGRRLWLIDLERELVGRCNGGLGLIDGGDVVGSATAAT